jgi:hypothetical protein
VSKSVKLPVKKAAEFFRQTGQKVLSKELATLAGSQI